MGRNHLKTGNVNVVCPAVLFLNQDKARAMEVQCNGRYKAW